MSCTSKLVSTAVDKQFKVIWRKTYAWYGHLPLTAEGWWL